MVSKQGAKLRKMVNVTRNTTVASHVEKADDPISRFFGLMGRPSIPQGYGLWIVPCADIHSCFMRFEFDAVFVSRENTVLYMLERMKPWRLSKFVRGGKAVLELPAGAIAASGTQVGDQLEWQDAEDP